MKSIAEISRLDTIREKKNSSELECRKIENIQIKGTKVILKIYLRSVRQYQAA